MVGPGEADRYLRRSLDQLKRLCDDVMIVLNHADEKTKKMVCEYGFLWYTDDREWGRHQPYIKEELVKRLAIFKPDWVIAMDADEMFDFIVSRETLESLAMPTQLAWYFYVVNFWNDEEHHNPGLNFWNVRFFKYDTQRGFEYEHKALHCGLAPKWAYHRGSYSPYILKHFGLMNPKDRVRKKERYDKYDPNAVHKSASYYEEIATERKPAIFDLDHMRSEVDKEVAKYKVKDKSNIPTIEPMKFVYLQREDGSVVEIPDRHVDQTLKLHPHWTKLREVIVGSNTTPPPAAELPPVEADPLECGICGYVGKSEHALKIHNSKSHV